MSRCPSERVVPSRRIAATECCFPCKAAALRALLAFRQSQLSRFAGNSQCYRPRSWMSAITELFAGIPVSDLDASVDWYTRFFGRPPDRRAGDEVLWEIDEHAWLFIEPNADHAGAGRITLAVAGLDELLQGLAYQGIEDEPIETYSNGVRHVESPDPDGNAIAFAEPPDQG